MPNASASSVSVPSCPKVSRALPDQHGQGQSAEPVLTGQRRGAASWPASFPSGETGQMTKLPSHLSSPSLVPATQELSLHSQSHCHSHLQGKSRELSANRWLCCQGGGAGPTRHSDPSVPPQDGGTWGELQKCWEHAPTCSGTTSRGLPRRTAAPWQQGRRSGRSPAGQMRRPPFQVCLSARVPGREPVSVPDT